MNVPTVAVLCLQKMNFCDFDSIMYIFFNAQGHQEVLPWLSLGRKDSGVTWAGLQQATGIEEIYCSTIHLFLNVPNYAFESQSHRSMFWPQAYLEFLLGQNMYMQFLFCEDSGGQ